MKKCFIILVFVLLAGCSSITMESLNDMPKQTVRNKFGEPVSIMRENNNEIWTYRQGQCIKYVFFDASEKVKYIDTKGNCWK